MVFSVLKYSITPQPSLVSSSASSGHNLTESSPDALSTSPKSPHSRLWGNASPDSNKISLKSSGSQTDSLDSPPTSTRSPTRAVVSHGDVEKSKSADKHYIKRFGKPFLNSIDRDRDRDEMVHSNTGIGLGIGRIKSGVAVSPASSHDSPPPLPTHPPPPLPSPHRTMEEEVIDDLNAIIHHYTKNPAPTTVNGSKEKRIRSRDKDENGGTWPKCRGPLDYPGGAQAFSPAVAQTNERSTLTVIASDHSYVRASTSPAGGSKVAPTPPERSDSFNRSKTINSSIKHSPQSSSEAQKYQVQSTSPSSSHQHPSMKSEVSSGMTHHIATHTPSSHPYLMTSTTKSSSYLSSPMSKQSPHSPLTSPQGLDKDGMKLMHSSVDSSKGGSLYEKSMIHYGTGSSPQSGADMPDNTVESVNNDEILRSYYNRRKQHRPNSAPGSHSREKRKETAQQIHGSHGGHGRTVPRSLNIQPIYSPRPVPHSRRNITPSSHGQSTGTGILSPVSTLQGYSVG